MRTVVENTEVRIVRRDNVTYEFGRQYEAGFTTVGGTTHSPLTTLWARRHNGYGWENLHYITLEG